MVRPAPENATSELAPPAQASRPAQPSRFYVPQLDGLRFLAFLLVFFHHGPKLSTLFAPLSRWTIPLRLLESLGWVGVDLFLVLSAYLITSLLLLEHDRFRGISLRGFYLRRILRIWPLYYLMTAIGFLLLPALALFAMPWGSPEHQRVMRDHFVPYLTLFGNFSSGRHGYPGIGTLQHLWTVTLEEQFYIVWPVVLSLLLRTRRAVLWGVLGMLLAGAISLRLALRDWAPHPFIWTHTLARLDPLLIGIAIAVWRHGHRATAGWVRPTAKLLVGAFLVGMVAAGGGVQVQSRNIAWQYLSAAVGFGLVLDAILARDGNPIAWLLTRRPLVWLGKLTYGLYVYHVIALEIGEYLTVTAAARLGIVQPHWLLPLRGLLSLGLTIAISAVSYRFFESFFLRFKDRFARVRSRPVDDRQEAQAKATAG